MQFTDQLTEYYNNANNKLQMSYSQIVECGWDIGFTSTIKDGRDFHQILHEIVISVMKFQANSLTNLVFSKNQQLRIEFQDDEIINYYSDYIELRYILSGTLKVEIEGAQVTFYENEICFIDSMAYHRELIDQSDCIIININIEKNIFNEAFLEQIGLNPLQKFIRTNIIKRGERNHYLKFTPTSIESNNTIQEYISNIFFEIRNHNPGYLSISKGYIVRLMDFLSHEYVYNFSREDSVKYNQKLFESVTEYMKENISSVQMNDLVKTFHFQPNYFNNLIKKNLGITYSQHLINMRIERAKSLLETTDLTVEEIIWLLGYNNKGFFYKKFKEETGINPAEFRAANFSHMK
jgi:YesN/AraC family two-component response regulator